MRILQAVWSKRIPLMVLFLPFLLHYRTMRSHLDLMHFTSVTEDHDARWMVAPGTDTLAAADSSRSSPRNNSSIVSNSNSNSSISSISSSIINNNNANAFASKSNNGICFNTTKSISYPARTKADRSKSKDAECVRERIAKFQKSHNRSLALKLASESTPEHKGPKNRNENQNRTRKQILYLHPGPPKTATSTIQKLLTDHWKDLLEDRIVYLGKTMPKEKWHCDFAQASYCTMYQFFQQQQSTNETCVDSIMDQLDEYYSLGMDVILSDEVIGAMFAPTAATKDQREALGIWNFVCQMVRRNDWEIRILIGYRPYFDFVRSAYFQTYRARGKPKLVQWPTKGGKHIPPLDQGGLFETTWTFSDQLVNTFRPFADRIEVFDITTNNATARGDVLVRFLCHHLEDAHRACSNARGGIRSNQGKSLEYDRIATAAAQKGLFDTFQFQRADVANQVERFWKTTTATNNNTAKELPLVCPSKRRSETLKTVSLEREMSLFPERNPHWETPDLFDAMMAKNQLCSVDVDKVLEDEDWNAFFRSLHQSRNFGTKHSRVKRQRQSNRMRQ